MRTITIATPRRQADVAVERPVQALGIKRTDIFVTPEGVDICAGSEPDGADVESGRPNVDPANDPA